MVHRTFRIGDEMECLNSVKLKYHKQYTGKEARDHVKYYHYLQELLLAFKTLDGHYVRPSVVIRESLRN